MAGYPASLAGGYEESWEAFAALVGVLDGPAGRGLDHGSLERLIDAHGRQLLRQLYQDHLDRRRDAELAAHHRTPQVVRGADGIERRRVEAGRARTMTSIFGTVRVERLVERSPTWHFARAALLALTVSMRSVWSLTGRALRAWPSAWPPRSAELRLHDDADGLHPAA